jgi:hypothetical protein
MKTAANALFKALPVALAISLAGASVSLSAAAADNTYAEVASVGEYAGWGDPAMAKIAIDSGRALVNHLYSAKALLEQKRIPQARSALIASHEFAAAIARVMPYLSVVEDMLDAGDRVVQENQEVLSADLLPIYASLDELDVYAPDVAHKTRGMLKQAEKDAAGGDKQHAAQELKQAAAVISEHTVYLPVDYVNEQVRVALNAVQKPKPDLAAAKAAVDRALTSVTLVVDAVVQTAAR